MKRARLIVEKSDDARAPISLTIPTSPSPPSRRQSSLEPGRPTVGVPDVLGDLGHRHVVIVTEKVLAGKYYHLA